VDALKGNAPEVTANMGLTTENLNTLKAKINEQLASADLGSELFAGLSNKLADGNALGNIMRVAFTEGIDLAAHGIDAKALWSALVNGEDIPDETWQSIVDIINEKLAELEIEPITIDVKSGNVNKAAQVVKESWQDAAKAVQAVGGALEQVKNPTAKIIGIIGQAVATIALGFATATTAAAAAGPWAWIAAIAAGMGTMISTIAAIHSATGYANGGIIKAAGGTIVPGNHMSGDMVPAMLNSGELVLNRAQQGNLASQLQGIGGNLNLSASVSAESIRFILTNNGRRTGRGDYLTTKFH
jgi:hypothetical protein